MLDLFDTLRQWKNYNQIKAKDSNWTITTPNERGLLRKNTGILNNSDAKETFRHFSAKVFLIELSSAGGLLYVIETSAPLDP